MNPLRDFFVIVAAIAVVLGVLLYINEHTWHANIFGTHIVGTK